MSANFSYTGDDIIPDAAMIYDRKKTVHAPASSIWPWLVQLGKGRGGWYLPASMERLLPKGWKASRQIEPCWQDLSVGDRVADYGTSKNDCFDVMVLDATRALVYKSVRYGTEFTWALLLEEHDGESKSKTQTTTVHLRFRGGIKSTGLSRRFYVWAGNWMDHLTTAPMLAGLAERAETSQGT